MDALIGGTMDILDFSAYVEQRLLEIGMSGDCVSRVCPLICRKAIDYAASYAKDIDQRFERTRVKR